MESQKKSSPCLAHHFFWDSTLSNLCFSSYWRKEKNVLLIQIFSWVWCRDRWGQFQGSGIERNSSPETPLTPSKEPSETWGRRKTDWSLFLISNKLRKIKIASEFKEYCVFLAVKVFYSAISQFKQQSKNATRHNCELAECTKIRSTLFDLFYPLSFISEKKSIIYALLPGFKQKWSKFCTKMFSNHSFICRNAQGSGQRFSSERQFQDCNSTMDPCVFEVVCKFLQIYLFQPSPYTVIGPNQEICGLFITF